MLQRRQNPECQIVLPEHAAFVLGNECSLSISAPVGTNRRGVVGRMTNRVVIEGLKLNRNLQYIH